MRCFAALAGAVAICAAGLTMASVAEATTFTQMIGDNDGYGVGIPDNGDAGSFADSACDSEYGQPLGGRGGGYEWRAVYRCVPRAFSMPFMDQTRRMSGSFVFSPFPGTVTSATHYDRHGWPSVGDCSV